MNRQPNANCAMCNEQCSIRRLHIANCSLLIWHSFMESEHLRISDVSWGHETSAAFAGSSGFSRLDARPPEGGTPYRGRFMERELFGSGGARACPPKLTERRRRRRALPSRSVETGEAVRAGDGLRRKECHRRSAARAERRALPCRSVETGEAVGGERPPALARESRP